MSDGNAEKKELGTSEYLSLAFDASDRIAILVRSASRKEIIQRIATAGRIADPSFQQWLRYKNDRDKFDIYVGMNPLHPNARTRTKHDIASIRHLYVDLDYEGREALRGILNSGSVPTPNYVLSTSPGKFQVVWRVEEIAQEPAERLLRQMARKFGGDPAATDSTRVLRLPGFLNRKYDQSFVVGAQLYSGRIHHARDFNLRTDQGESAYQQDNQPARQHRSTRTGPLTQSERDWAFAKRALARGADPDEVARDIADFRQGEKHDALDYARRTVAKAQAQLAQSSSTSAGDESREKGGHTL